MERIAEAQTLTEYSQALDELHSSHVWKVDDSHREYFENTWITESKASTLSEIDFMRSTVYCWQIVKCCMSGSDINNNKY